MTRTDPRYPSHSRPERTPLLLLCSALEIAQDAVRRQHQRLDYLPVTQHPSLPASEVVAEMLVERCADLHLLIERYNSIIDYALGPDEDLF